MVHQDPAVGKSAGPSSGASERPHGHSFPIRLPVRPRRRRRPSTPREARTLWAEIAHERCPAVPDGLAFDLLLLVEDEPPTRATLVLRLSHTRGRPIHLSRNTRIAILRATWSFLPLMAYDVGVKFDANEVRRILVGVLVNLRAAGRAAPAVVVPPE